MKMKKYLFLLLLVACLGGVAQAQEAAPATSLRIAYVDDDSIMANYTQAVDMQRRMRQRQHEFDSISARRSTELETLASEIEKLGKSIETKYKNNKYQTRSQLEKDQSRLAAKQESAQKKQQAAQQEIAELQQSIQDEMTQAQAALNLAVSGYVEEFARTNGYDMVLHKSAAWFLSSRFDVTPQVVEGLNERYSAH